MKHAKVDKAERVRYLSPEEEARLRTALDRREAKRRKARRKFNAWRRERGYKTFPDYISFTDHLKPITLVALNTGLRRGELFNLEWRDIDLDRRFLTVVGRTAKSGKTRHIPLNDEAHSVLSDWRKRPAAGDGELVFPASNGRLTTIKTAWLELMRAASIKGFRFHDTRYVASLIMFSVCFF